MLPLLGLLAPLLGKVVGTIGNIIDQKVEDKDLANKLKAEAAAQILNQDNEEYLTHLKEAASVIRAEAQSESFIARNWRPIIMLLFGGIIANNYILFPWFNALGLPAVTMNIPPDMWALLKLGIGGYVVSRGVEKSIDKWKQNLVKP